MEIVRGRTEHPLRPVQSPRFLIGSSPRCDLQLGAADIPPLHCLISVDGPDIWAEAMAPSPVLRVNGRRETSVQIVDGDRIEIGPIELVAHVREGQKGTAAAAAAAAAQTTELDTDEIADEPEPAELSALELVERIEAATELVNQFEERQRLGIEALLHAVEGRDPILQTTSGDQTAGSVLPIADSLIQPSESEPLDDLESLVMQLSSVVAELERRSGIEKRREAGYRNAVSALFETQDRLSRQLEILLRRVASLNADQSHREPGRAIA